MSEFIVEGGCRLQGSIEPQGAKNEALQVICATLLTSERVTISNLPDIADVNNLVDLLSHLGVKTSYIDAHTCEFQADNVNLSYLHTEEFLKKAQALRGSVMSITSFLTYTNPKPQYIVLLCQLTLYFVEAKDKTTEGEHEQ